MKALFTTLFAAVVATAFANGEPTVVVLQDQHGNYNTMFVPSQQARTSIALSVKGQGAASRSRDEQQQDYRQAATSEYRSR